MPVQGTAQTHVGHRNLSSLTGLCAVLPRRCLTIHKTCGEGEGRVVNETELKYPGVAVAKGQNSLWVQVSAEKTEVPPWQKGGFMRKCI